MTVVYVFDVFQGILLLMCKQESVHGELVKRETSVCIVLSLLERLKRRFLVLYLLLFLCKGTHHFFFFFF